MTSTSARRWTPGDFGDAMARYVEAHADHVRISGDKIESEAFYRDGDNESALAVWPERGAWADARAGVSGGARDFARVVARMDFGEFMRTYGGEASGAPAARVQRGPDPREQVERRQRFVREARAFFDELVTVDEVPSVVAWLESRGFDVARVVDAGVARAIPAGLRMPHWARQAGRPWIGTWDLVLPFFDARGTLQGLHARATVATAPTKTTSPGGQSTKGLCLADQLGRVLLGGAPSAAAHVMRVSAGGGDGVVIVEGAPGFLAHAIESSDADEGAPAVIGITSGGWSADHAARIPDGARVLVDTDHGDKQGDGDRYAADIAASLAGRGVTINRIKREPRE
jgi:hypothetical protein